MLQLFGWTTPRSLAFHHVRSVVLEQCFPREDVSHHSEKSVFVHYLDVHLVLVVCSAPGRCDSYDCWMDQYVPGGCEGYAAVLVLEIINE